MSSNYVNQQNSERLFDAGFPQDKHPQMAWTPYLAAKGGRFHIQRWIESPLGPDEYAAPTHLAALEWLETEKGYHWCRSDDSKYLARLRVGDPRVMEIWIGGYTGFDTPDELISAILDHLEGVSRD